MRLLTALTLLVAMLALTTSVLADRPEHEELVKTLSAKLKAGWQAAR